MKSILDKDLVLKGKKVIVRVDLNVPMKDGAITEISQNSKNFTHYKIINRKRS